MNNYEKKDVFDCFIKIILIFCLLVFYIRYLEKLHCITIVGDEFGYWANAAEFIGYDWSAIAGINTYYSFGYSLFLVPILTLFESSIAYKMAILLNVFFVILSFILLNHILMDFRQNIDVKIVYLISFAVSLTPNLYFQTLTTQCESLMFFVFCLLVYIFQKMVKNYSDILLIIFNVVLFYSYSIHMRNIGIVIAGVVAEIIYILQSSINKKKKSIGIIIIMIIAFAFFIGAENIKKYLIENLYQANEIVQVNTYTGQVGKLSYIFSSKGIKHLFASLCGKIFYFGAATFLIGYVGIFKIGEKISAGLKNKKIEIVSIFILLSFFSQIAIDAIYMIYPTERLDTLIYGRYFEHTIGPILGIGLLALVDNGISGKRQEFSKHLYVITVFIINTVITYKAAKELDIRRYFPGNAVALVKLGNENDVLRTEKLIYLAGIWGILIFFFVLFFLERKNKILLGYIIVFIGLMWMDNGKYEVVNTTIKNQGRIEELSRIIKKMPEEYSIYFINESMGEFNTIDYVQYIVKEKSVNVIDSNEINNIDKNAYIITYLETPMSEKMKNQCENYYITPYMNIFEYKLP